VKSLNTSLAAPQDIEGETQKKPKKKFKLDTANKELKEPK
jgi:hypothetical protein